jgi:hypothetical protein
LVLSIPSSGSCLLLALIEIYILCAHSTSMSSRQLLFPISSFYQIILYNVLSVNREIRGLPVLVSPTRHRRMSFIWPTTSSRPREDCSGWVRLPKTFRSQNRRTRPVAEYSAVPRLWLLERWECFSFRHGPPPVIAVIKMFSDKRPETSESRRIIAEADGGFVG